MQKIKEVTKDKVFFLKGVELLNNLYERPHERSMSDIDILIDPKEWLQLKKDFETLGFQEVPEKKWEANSFKKTMTKDIFSTEITLEIHERLFFEEPSHFFWKKDLKNHTLSKNDFLLHLIGHASYQHTFIKLFWLVDIDRFIRRHHKDVDWKRILERSKELKIYQATNTTLWILKNLFSTPHIPLVKRKTWYYLLNWNFLILSRKKKLSYWVTKHKIKDSLASSLKYDWLWLKNQLYRPNFEKQ